MLRKVVIFLGRQILKYEPLSDPPPPPPPPVIKTCEWGPWEIDTLEKISKLVKMFLKLHDQLNVVYLYMYTLPFLYINDHS